MKYKATRVHEVLLESGFIQPDGYSKLTLRNEGSKDVTIYGIITIPPYFEKTYDELPGVEISDRIPVRFENADNSKKLIIEKTYYKTRL